MKRYLFLALLALTSCFQTYNEDDDLRTVPITNNPNVVPNYGGGMPGVGSSGKQGPY